MLIPRATKERAYVAQGRPLIFGVDEAGRGCLAGPVVAAAVLFDWTDESFRKKFKGMVRDSKLMTRAHRQEMFAVICEHALGWGIGVVHAPEIDQRNIFQANLVAMRYALQGADHDPDLARSVGLIDGTHTVPLLELQQERCIDGDARIVSIAAASILAKEHRDRLMEHYDLEHPQYGFAKHKGYGTRQHFLALENHGLTPQHRKTFLKKLLLKSE